MPTTTTDVPTNHWAQAERAALCSLMDEVGADAPTLCEGWTTRDLAAHLVVREGRPDAAIGIAVPALAGWTKKVQDGAAAGPWDQLVAKVRTGPPRTSMMRIAQVDGAANTIEFFVHLEDVRRAQPEWEPRELDTDFEDVLWSKLSSFAPRLMKPSPVGVELVTPDGRHLVAKEGPDVVTITGAVGELTLLAYGRDAVRVEYTGTNEAIAAVNAARFGI